jgi:hypothetical protein
MKWLFFLLIFGNMGFFAWHQLEAGQSSVVVKSVYAPPVSQKIVTLEETDPTLEGINESETKDVVGTEVKDDLERKLEAIVENAVLARGQEGGVAYCPIIEVEKDQDRVKLIAKLGQFGWRYRDDEYKSNSLKYWLYINAPNTRSEAADIMSELKQKGIDSFRITRGEMKNRISLGLYSIEKAAQEEERRIESLVDYSVETFEHNRVVSILKIQIVDKITRVQLSELENWMKLSKMMINLEKNPC